MKRTFTGRASPNTLTGPHRLPLSKKFKRPTLVRFTPELWDQWRADRKADSHTTVLREGIADLRQLLDQRDLHHRPLSR